MSRPLAEMSVAMQKNIKEAKEAQVKAQLADSEAVDFEKQLHVEGVDLEYQDLGYPRTVCTHPKCIEYIAAGKDNIQQVNYRQHCHPHCGLSGVPTETVGDSRLQGCAAMAADRTTCRICTHSYNVHMHRTYDLVTVKRSFISEEVQKKIKEKKDAKSKMEAIVQEMTSLQFEFKSEQQEVFRVSAAYGAFLRDAALIPYNDALGDYLDMIIHQEEEKHSDLRDQDMIYRLHQQKKAYEEEKKAIESAVQGPGLSVTPEQIVKLQEDLFKMKHFGPSLMTIFYRIEKGNRASYEQRKVVYNTTSLRSRVLECVNPIKKFFLSLVRGSQSSEDKIEKLEKIESLVSESTDKLDVEDLPNLPETSSDDDDEFVSFNETVSADATTKEGSPTDEELD